MSIYIGNNLEDRLKALEIENASLKKYSEYHQVIHEIDHMSDLHLDCRFYKQLMDIDNYFKIKEWHDSSIGQSMVIQQLDKKRPKLSNLNQTQNRRRYVNFENGSHFICSLNLNNPELTVCISFRMNSIASENQLLFNDRSFEFLFNNFARLTNIISEECPTFALFKSVFRLHLLYMVFKLCTLKVKGLEKFRAFAFCLKL